MASLLCACAVDAGGAVAGHRLAELTRRFKVAKVAVCANALPPGTLAEDALLAEHFALRSADGSQESHAAVLTDSLTLGIDGDSQEPAFAVTAEDILALRLPFEFLQKDCEQKLVALEDLFDIFLVCLAGNLAPPPVQVLAADAPSLEEPVSSPPCGDPSVVCSFLAPHYSSGALLGPTSQWTPALDVRLMRAVLQLGWPASKKKWLALQTALFGEGAEEAPQDFRDVAAHLKAVVRALRYASDALRCLLRKRCWPRGERFRMTAPLPFSAAVLRALGKVGRPQTLYASLPDAAALLSWEQLLEECGKHSSLDLPRLRSVVAEVEALVAEPDRTLDRGLLFGLSSRAVADARAKADAMYRIRTLLGSRSEAALLAEIALKAMQTGASVPAYARDKSMPIWWTPAHDARLLRLTCAHGLHQWKKVLAGDADGLSLVEAPLDFEMPLRESGADWLLALSAKAAEKRLAHLLRALDAFGPVGALPMSPPRPLPSAPTKAGARPPKPATRPSAVSSIWSKIAAVADAPKTLAVAPAPAPATAASSSEAAEVVAMETENSCQSQSPVPASEEALESAPEAAQAEHEAPPVSASACALMCTPSVPSCEPVRIDSTSQTAAAPSAESEGSPAADFADRIVAAQPPKTQPAASSKASAPKKRKAADPKVSTKKPAPASASILSFFGRKSAGPAIAANPEGPTEGQAPAAGQTDEAAAAMDVSE